MCGIWGVLSNTRISPSQKVKLYEKYDAISHRGPDRHSFVELDQPVNAILGFHRLAIMDTSARGDQPFVYDVSEDESNDRCPHTVYVMCNGEIYEHKEIAKQFDLELKSGSDCEVIPLMYKKFGLNGIKKMLDIFNSEHAFFILDVNRQSGDYVAYFSEDRFGIRPLFIGQDEFGFYFSSELIGIGCLNNKASKIERFKPRHYATLKKIDGAIQPLEYTCYYDLKNIPITCYDVETAAQNIERELTRAVITRMDADRPLACLLSGGLDSSLVSAIAAKYLEKTGKKLRTFCVGLEEGSDAPFAQAVADHAGCIHTNIIFSEEEFINAIPEIVRVTGSYDVTSVRATTGQFLASKWISQNTDIKVLLVGDGADEVQLSYLYGHNAPDGKAFHDESVRLVEDIHLFDGLRADRGVAYWGIEVRFPFLDKRYVECYLSIDPTLRMSKGAIEKWLVRFAFSTQNSKESEESAILPENCLWRVKEAFSDGVSSRKRSWKDVLIEKANEYCEKKKHKFDEVKHLPAISNEAQYYRDLFCEYYGNNESVSETIPYYWLPKWCGNVTDPSARVLDIYKKSHNE